MIDDDRRPLMSGGGGGGGGVGIDGGVHTHHHSGGGGGGHHHHHHHAHTTAVNVAGDDVYSDVSAVSAHDPLAGGLPPSGDLKDGHKQTLGVAGGVCLIAATIMGAGLIALPSSMTQQGWVLGIFLLIAFCLITIYGCDLMVKAALHVGAPTYERLGEAAFGRWGTLAASASMMALIYGACVGYLVIVGDVLTPVFYCAVKDTLDYDVARWIGSRAVITCVFTALFVFPLCMLRTIGTLDKFSALAVAVMLAFAGTVIVDGAVSGRVAVNDDGDGVVRRTAFLDVSIFKSVSIYAFAYGVQFNVFPVIEELEVQSLTQYRRVFAGGLFTSMTLYIAVGVVGYLSFGEAVAGDYFESWSNGPTWFKILRVFFALALAVHYPLTHFAFRQTVVHLVFDDEFTWLRHTLLTLVFVASTVIVAIVLPSITHILGLAGAIGSFMIGYILPSLFYLKIMPGDLRTLDGVRAKFGALALFIFGIFVGVVSTVMSIKDIVDFYTSEQAESRVVCG